MELIEKKKIGNPNFAKKSGNSTPTVQRDYRYQLTETFDKIKPVDNKTGEMVDNPYPPLRIIPNAGVELDPKTKEVRQWRYVYGYPTIWVDEQKPEPTKRQLESERNTIAFTKGFLRVNPNDKAKILALEVQSIFEGNTNKLEQKPSQYRLIDENREIANVRSIADEAYEAETAARSATIEQLLPVAMVFGIDVNNYDENEDRIRTQTILAAKNNPSGFLRQYINPMNDIKYVVTMALQTNIISSSKIDDKIVMVDTDKVLFDIKSDGDVPDQIAKMVIREEEIAVKLYERLKSLLA